MSDPLTQDPVSVIEHGVRWLSHAVHHYALIAVIGRRRDRPVDEDFGVAPSTLKHRRRAGAACAP